jgi:hypothetical protein
MNVLNYFTGMLAALFLASGAQGATVQLVACFVPTESCATGITGLDVDGSLYDVSFVFDTFTTLNTAGNFPFLGDQTAAELAAGAIAIELNAASAARVIVGPLGPEYFVTFIPYSSSFLATRAVNQGVDWFSVSPTGTNSATTSYSFSIFTSTGNATVPIPATSWLLGSGLAIMGWIKRRSLC